MTNVGTIGGYQTKVVLTEQDGKLVLDGARRDGSTWRPLPIELTQPQIEALNKALSALEPVPSALQELVRERLEVGS